jgi:signal transduction histidine kinase
MSQPPALPAAARVSPSMVGLQAVGAMLKPRRGPLRKKTLLVYAASVLAQYGLDVLAVGLDGGMLGMRLLWALGLALSAWRLDESSESSARLHSLLHAGFGSLCVLGLVCFSGGSRSPYFELLSLVPLLLSLIYPQDTRQVPVSGAVTVLGLVGLLVVEGQPISRVLLWVGITVSFTVTGIFSGRQFRKAQQAESEARLERTRREALERLAISERRRTQSEKLATIGQLAAGVVHEINNPLAFVHSNLAYLEEQGRTRGQLSPEELTEVLRETRAGVERVRQIVADLRGFSRMDAEAPAECALVDVVNDAARLASLRLKHVARLEVDVPATLPAVRVVRRRLAQVLLNLLVNAGDALEGQGHRSSQVRVTGRREGSRVLLLVEDNGPGFPPQVLPRLFEAFFTTKNPEKGTGLGLALSRELVEQFGGTLVAENRPEGGARLRLELPCRA